jgi:hypothetical protein
MYISIHTKKGDVRTAADRLTLKAESSSEREFLSILANALHTGQAIELPAIGKTLRVVSIEKSAASEGRV